eukprot:11116161-Alexandrium_andersonii.AAC.1
MREALPRQNRPALPTVSHRPQREDNQTSGQARQSSRDLRAVAQAHCQQTRHHVTDSVGRNASCKGLIELPGELRDNFLPVRLGIMNHDLSPTHTLA